LSITRPAITAVRAINKAGKERVSFTRAGPFGISANVSDISGREAEIVIIDIMVRLLTNNRVAFTCQVSEFMIYGFKRMPPAVAEGIR
jgi:hypothetical protein